MTNEYAIKGLADATMNRDAARAAFEGARKGSRKWLEASEDLSFWSGKVAFFEAAAKNVQDGRW